MNLKRYDVQCGDCRSYGYAEDACYCASVRELGRGATLPLGNANESHKRLWWKFWGPSCWKFEEKAPVRPLFTKRPCLSCGRMNEIGSHCPVCKEGLYWANKTSEQLGRSKTHDYPTSKWRRAAEAPEGLYFWTSWQDLLGHEITELVQKVHEAEDGWETAWYDASDGDSAINDDAPTFMLDDAWVFGPVQPMPEELRLSIMEERSV